eukprot:3459467-Prymnesium_polylepis.2
MWSHELISPHESSSATWRSPGQCPFNSWASSRAPGLCELQCTLTVNAARLRLGQQPLAHDHHGAVLEWRDARPQEGWQLEQGVADLRACRRLDLGHTPVGRPLGQLLLELPPRRPLIGHNLGNHRCGEHTVHLGIGQQQRDLLVAHDRAG